MWNEFSSDKNPIQESSCQSVPYFIPKTGDIELCYKKDQMSKSSLSFEINSLTFGDISEKGGQFELILMGDDKKHVFSMKNRSRRSLRCSTMPGTCYIGPGCAREVYRPLPTGLSITNTTFCSFQITILL